MRMDIAIKNRMRAALEMKGLNHYEVSKAAGFHPNYLWESFDEERGKGSLSGYKRVAGVIGLNFTWLVDGHGEPFGFSKPPLDRT